MIYERTIAKWMFREQYEPTNYEQKKDQFLHKNMTQVKY